MGGVDSETIALPTLKTNCATFRAGDIHPWLFCGHQHRVILDLRFEILDGLVILIKNRKSHGAWGGFTGEFCHAPIIFRTDASELKKLGFSLLVKNRDAVFH